MCSFFVAVDALAHFAVSRTPVPVLTSANHSCRWQTGLLCITDVIVKLGFGFYLISDVDGEESGGAPLNQSSQQYV